jgi:hypothetical protein
MQIQRVFFITGLSTAKQAALSVAVQNNVHSTVASTSHLMIKKYSLYKTTTPYLQVFVLKME